MKTIYSLFAILLVASAGCSTTLHKATGAKKKDQRETVMVIYHAQSGKEAELQSVLAHAWDVYRKEQMVDSKPHTIVRDAEGAGNNRFVEIFTWVKAPDHAPDSVLAVWKQEQSLCEARGGHRGIEGGAVDLIAGK